MNRRIILIDGNFLILRCFFGAMNSYRHGNPVIYAWELILNKVFEIKQKWPKADVFLVLEGCKKVIRKFQVYSEYKSNRKKTLPRIFVRELRHTTYFCSIIGLPVIRNIRYEADDLIASIASRYEHEGEVLIFTQDKDFYQIVSDNIKMIDFELNVTDRNRVMERLKLRRSNQITTYYALVGDAADNLKGVPGVGPKSALRLLNQYDNITNVVKNIDNLGRYSDLIRNNLRGLIVNLYMVTLKKNISFKTLPESKLFEKKYQIECFLRKNHCYHLLNKLTSWWDSRLIWEN